MSKKELIDDCMEAEMAFSPSNPRSCIGTNHLKEAVNSLINARIHLHKAKGGESFEKVNSYIDKALEGLSTLTKENQ